MVYVVTQHCCSDAACVSVCPVNCIHPTPDEPGFATADMLYIDPGTCIDCGACADACPTGAIRADGLLRPKDLPFVELNAGYFRDNPTTPGWSTVPRFVDTPTKRGAIRVAVVGAGAAGLYAVRELLTHPGTEVELFDRVGATGGLVRYGVAPDHVDTKAFMDQFRFPPAKAARLTTHLGVEIGVDISHDELSAFHHAVIYCNGANTAARLDVPGADLVGNYTGLEFAGWYNGHPDHAGIEVDLSGSRAVVVGNGNVALDVARMLCLPGDVLAATDIAADVLAALRASAIREVLVLGRKGPADAAFSVAELLGLVNTPGIRMAVDASPQALAAVAEPLRSLLDSISAQSDSDLPLITLVFDAEVEQIHGNAHVAAVTIRRRAADGTVSLETVEAGLLVHSIGVRSTAIPGLPFDADAAIVPNDGGRVVRDGGVVVGTYVAGWSKRGPVGVIGTNRKCAQETVTHVIEDFVSGRLGSVVGATGQGEVVRSAN
jgi:ferredoxin/flavodoxin---NADP+ reductase